MSVEDWPLSTDEISVLRSTVGQKLSMLKVVNYYCRNIEEIASPTFTHKCTCPNMEHKQGNEKTPSFFFSEKDKTFMCFGCQIRGDVFDLLARMTKRPLHTIINDFAKKNNISADLLDFTGAAVQRFDFIDLKHNICIDIRNYLMGRVSEPSYKDDCDWADSLFRRIDDRFDKFTDADYQQAKFFTMQVGIEIERRKSE